MALGDTIYLYLNQSVIGYGDALTVVGPLTETAQTEAMVVNGLATVVAGPGVPLPSSVPAEYRFASRASVSPLLRQHRAGVRLGPVTTDITSYANSTTPDASLTKVYAMPASGLSNGTARMLTSAEIAALPFITTPRPSTIVYSGEGYLGFPGTANIDLAGVGAVLPLLTTRTYELMTDQAKLDIHVYRPLGTELLQIWVDDMPVGPAGTVGPAIIDPGNALGWQHLVFPSAKTRKVKIRTGAWIGNLHVGPVGSVWRPQSPAGPRVLVVGDSYVQPTVYDDTTGATVPYIYGWAQQLAECIDVDEVLTEGIGGTGFSFRNTSAGAGLGGPINNYLDRCPGHISLNPDVVIFGAAFANDMYQLTYNSVGSVAQSVANANAYMTQMRAARPNVKFIALNGWRAPGYGNFTTLYAQCVAALQALRTDVYYIDVNSMIDVGGGYVPGHTNGLGNSDLYIGPDGIHPTIKGHAYLRDRLAPAIQRIITDNGALLNTMVAA